MRNIVGLILIGCMAGWVSAAAAAEEKSDKKAESRTVNPQRPAKVYCTQLEVLFKKDNAYQPNTRFADVPERYSEWYITLYRGGSGDQPLKVKVKEAGVVTLANLPIRTKHYIEEEGWAEVGRFTIYNTAKEKSLTYIIIEKFLEEGTYMFDAAGSAGKRHPLLLRQP